MPPRRQTRPRLEAVKKAYTFDDQRTAAEIATSEATSTTQEEFQEYVLSQIKRIIHGDLLGRWFSDPTQASSPLQVLKDLVLGQRWGVELIGSLDGVNRTFATPEKFLHGTYNGGIPRIRIYHNGRRLQEGVEFEAFESVPGAGYNRVRVLLFAPSQYSGLVADYVVQP